MRFTELTKEQFESFASKHPEGSFMQSSGLGDLRKYQGFDVYYTGVEENGEILCAACFCADPVFLGRKLFYAPRGYLIDWHNKPLLTFYTKEMKKFVNAHGGFRIVIDPNHIYREREKDGSLLADKPADEESFNNLISLGYKHFGFNLYLETRQVRWAYRMLMDEPYEEKKKQFSKSTRKNLEKAYSRGLRVRRGTADDLEIMENLFRNTAERKDFDFRETEYYIDMYRYMGDMMTIYIARLEADAYVACAEQNLREEEAANRKIAEEMERANVGAKLLKKKETSDNRIIKLKQDLADAESFRNEYPEGRDVAALLSMKNGEEYLTLTSGSLEEYRSFTPKYAMYDAHIRDAYEMGFRACNFYGISGNFEKEGNIFYGVYEFKRGFGGHVIEYIGEFNLNTNVIGTVYDTLRAIRNRLKGRS